MAMTTNLYIILQAAQAWRAAHPGSVMTLAIERTGGLSVRVEDAVDHSTWGLSALDLRKSFATANTLPVLADFNSPITPAFPMNMTEEGALGQTLQGMVSHPAGLGSLIERLADVNDSLTIAITAQAAADTALIQAQQSIDPWPTVSEPAPVVAPAYVRFTGVV